MRVGLGSVTQKTASQAIVTVPAVQRDFCHLQIPDGVCPPLPKQAFSGTLELKCDFSFSISVGFVFPARLLLSSPERVFVSSCSLLFCLVGTANSLENGAAKMPQSHDAWEARLKIC